MLTASLRPEVVKDINGKTHGAACAYKNKKRSPGIVFRQSIGTDIKYGHDGQESKAKNFQILHREGVGIFVSQC
jgi:hypothetical protein